MATSRAPRKSEETFTQVWIQMMHLASCVWAQLVEDAEERMDAVIAGLHKVKELMKEGN